MGHLIRTLNNPEELGRLPEAYCVLAKAYLEHRSGHMAGVGSHVPFSYNDLRIVVVRSESEVSLKSLKHECDLIDAEVERPVELFNNLGQIEVLIAAINTLGQFGLEAQRGAPTQQSRDSSGMEVADLEGDGWKLEAYGGQKCSSNKKLYEDICTLNQACRSGERMFLAFRRSAWDATYKTRRLSTREPTSVVGTTRKARARYRGKKVSVSANLTLIGELEGVCVCKVKDIICNPSLDDAPAAGENSRSRS